MLDHADAQHSLSELSEMLEVQHLAEALELGKMLKDSHDDVLQEVRRYAQVLGELDPAHFNPAQAVGQVVLRLSYARTPHERLDTITSEARRLMQAVAEAKHKTRLRVLSAAAVVASVCITGICAAVLFIPA